MTAAGGTTLSDLLDLHPLATPAWRAAVAAGAFLRDERPPALAVETKSTPSDAVTAMDRGAEALIVHALLGERPDDGLLGEEGGERAGTSGVRWVVDPLDGTVNYLYRLPNWAVSIAAEVDGVAQVGVVVAPDLGEAYVGIAGAGAWSVTGASATRLSCSATTDLSASLVVTGFNYSDALRMRQAQVVAGLIGDVRDIRRLGAATVDLCWVARGRLEAFYERGLNAWDIAAGAVIAREAGAVVTGLSADEAPGSSFLLAAAPGITDALRERLVTLAADR